MGILIQFPQPDTPTLPGNSPSGQSDEQSRRLDAAYRCDLDRAVALLLEHVESGAYDGVALILKPTSPSHRPALVVGGFYRHKLSQAAAAAMQLHLAIKLRARERAAEPPTSEMQQDHQQASRITQGVTMFDMEAALKKKWDAAALRYRRCEQLLRIAFSNQLRASPETTAILLSITQLHIETVANCLWEVVRQPGRATLQTKLETLHAIQLFRNARAQVSAWMPPADQAAAYFTANSRALCEEMLTAGDSLLSEVETALERIAGDGSLKSVGT